MRKKLLAILLTVCMVMSLAPAAFAVEECLPDKHEFVVDGAAAECSVCGLDAIVIDNAKQSTNIQTNIANALADENSQGKVVVLLTEGTYTNSSFIDVQGTDVTIIGLGNGATIKNTDAYGTVYVHDDTDPESHSKATLVNLTLENAYSASHWRAVALHVKYNSTVDMYGVTIDSTKSSAAIAVHNGETFVAFDGQYHDVTAQVNCYGCEINMPVALEAQPFSGTPDALTHVVFNYDEESEIDSFTYGNTLSVGNILVNGEAANPAPVVVISDGVSTPYSTLAEAIAAAGADDTVKLMKDLTLSEYIDINKDVKIDGDNHEITSTATRILRVTEDGVDLELKNIKFVSETAERGVQVDPDVEATLDIDNCTIPGTYYAVNICNGTAVNLRISNSVISGWSALNLWNAGYIVDVTKTVLNGHNDKPYGISNSFGVVVIEGDTTSATEMGAENNSITLTDCEVNATSDTANKQYAFLFNTNSEANVVTLKGENTFVSAAAGQLARDDGTDNSFVIESGYFTVDPSAYLASGLAAGASGDTDYPYTVVEKSEDVTVDTHVAAGTGSAAAGEGVTDEETLNFAAALGSNADAQAKVAADAAAGLGAEASTLANSDAVVGDAAVIEAVKEVASEETDLGETVGEALTAVLEENNVSVAPEATVTVVIQPYLDVTVNDVDATNKVVAVDIKPKYDIIATTNTSDIKTEGNDQNAVVLKESVPMEVTVPVTVTIPLPAGFAADGATVYIVHTKDEGDQYRYEAAVSEVSGQLYATFVNPNGFSGFVVYADEPVAQVVGGSAYTTLQAAADAITTGTIKLLDNIDGGASPALVVGDGKNITLDLNGFDITSASGNYTIDIAGNGGGYANGTATTGKLTIINTGAAAEIVNTSSPSTVIRNFGTLTIGTQGGDNSKIVVTRGVGDSSGRSAIKNEDNSTVNIYSGTFGGDTRSMQNFGFANIYGGIFENQVQAWKRGSNDNKLAIYGGTFDAEVIERNTGSGDYVDFGTLEITGGSFLCTKNPISDLIPNIAYGYVAVSSGDYFVVSYVGEELPAPVDPTPGTPVVPGDDECDGGAECPHNDFTDLDNTAWYHDAVDYVIEKGIMNGVDDGKFDPAGSASRAMIWTMLARLDGANTEAGQTWYEVGQQWAIDNGISDGSMVGDAITREQMVTMLYRYCLYKGYDVSVGENTNILSYNDAFEISEWAYAPFQWACGAGITEGSDGYLTPGAGAQRCQLAAMFMRFIENVVNA